MLLLLKTTQLWLNIYENYFLMPEMFKLSVVILGILGAPDKPCGVVCADVNPKTVAKRYMIVQKVVSLHYESEWQ